MENGPNPKLLIEFGVLADKKNMNVIPATLKNIPDIISKHLANLFAFLLANKLLLWTYPTWRSAFLVFFSIAAKTFKNSPDLHSYNIGVNKIERSSFDLDKIWAKTFPWA